eukprot:CAMPEP_0176061922 /NCGR_PEP_ID=MMETSP0120_2-20121206/30874_1 /TAXON_ID=160619 /ORGANISM="Kryptoperidinium foliaceum, Strain CCMP 1326" /LENGTH=30 /DNA_ID= /DNA_START= /DNA_END= /DNA_ORIENTATION=
MAASGRRRLRTPRADAQLRACPSNRRASAS